jgi:hypothetical protein
MLSPTAPSCTPRSADPGSGSGTGPTLLCVDPARVGEFWPHVRELIRQALLRADLDAFAPLEAAILNGSTYTLLWLAWDGKHIAAAAVTELQITMRRKVCVILACGAPSFAKASEGNRPSSPRLRRARGLGRRSLGEAGWLPLIAGIEKYALAEGCAAVRIIGRRGWARVLPHYREHRVILERKV